MGKKTYMAGELLSAHEAPAVLQVECAITGPAWCFERIQ